MRSSKGVSGGRRRIGGERGQAMAELALVMPILLLVLVGIFEFGRIFNYWIDSTHIAAEGVRWAAVDRNPGGGSQDLQTWIRSQAPTAEMADGLAVCIEFQQDNGDWLSTIPNDVAQGDAIRVKVVKNYNSFVPIVGGLFGGSLKFSAITTMRVEQLLDNGTAPLNYTPANNIVPSECAPTS